MSTEPDETLPRQESDLGTPEESAPLFKRLIPILFVDNLEAERDFYVQLGFTVSYQGPEFPDFISLAYGALEFGIESTPDADPQLPNRVLTWQWAVTDIELAKRRLTSAGVSFQEVWVTPRDDWKYRVLHARTPNGYHLMLEGANE
jgi:catechol 2,3-dioxygenase-like lactoylglutathione lyase family enzyme